jgi:hypothetical protein
MMVDYAGTVKTNGARILVFALSLLLYNVEAANNADNSVIVIVIGIIDAKTGNVLWTNMLMD